MSDNKDRCDCCKKEPSIGVAALPGMPMSIAWCKKCLEAEVIPMWAAITTTACIGGMDGAAQWWKDLVERSLTYHKYPRAQFDAAVAHEIATMDQMSEMEPDETISKLPEDLF